MAVETEQTTEAKLRSQLERYEAFFAEIDSFVDYVKQERELLDIAVAKESELKAKYDHARKETRALRDSIAGSKDALFRLVEPGATKFLPLFDRMEPADPDKHGEKSDEWRNDPISALRLSPNTTSILIDADIVAIGQLQDIVLENPSDWWTSIEGITEAVAAAIADSLNDFIARDGGR